MKRILYIISLVFILTSCGSTQYGDRMNDLTVGMSKGDVSYLLGYPERVLAINRTQNGLQEVLQYRNYQNEVYALEFWDDYLIDYEYLYDDTPFYAPMGPPRVLRPMGSPIFIIDGRDSNRPRYAQPSHSGRYDRLNNDRRARDSRPNSSYESNRRSKSSSNNSRTTDRRYNNDRNSVSTRTSDADKQKESSSKNNRRSSNRESNTSSERSSSNDNSRRSSNSNRDSRTSSTRSTSRTESSDSSSSSSSNTRSSSGSSSTTSSSRSSGGRR